MVDFFYVPCQELTKSRRQKVIRKKRKQKKFKPIFSRIKALKLLWPNTNRDENIFFFSEEERPNCQLKQKKLNTSYPHLVRSYITL